MSLSMLPMAVPETDDVWSPATVRTGLEKVRELGQQVRNRTIAKVPTLQQLNSLKDVLVNTYSREKNSVVLKFLMSMFVFITFVTIPLTAIYFFDPEFFFTNQGPAMPGEVDSIASTIKSTSFDLKWRASGGRVDKYIVKISDYSTFGAEYETEGPSPSLRIENLEVNTRYKLAIFAVRDNIKSEPRTENLKTKDVKVYWGCMTKAILTGGIAIAGVSAFAPFLGAVGFGAAGIGKGTMAASWMSSFGGTVASGGLFSTLQSLGVVGLGASAKAAIIASGMALGCIVEVI